MALREQKQTTFRPEDCGFKRTKANDISPGGLWLQVDKSKRHFAWRTVALREQKQTTFRLEDCGFKRTKANNISPGGLWL